jgi:peroxiredoxin
LRRRLETAGVQVMIKWTGDPGDSRGVVLVPDEQSEFAAAVVNEIDVDDEVADNSPHAYVARIEEHLSAAAGLLEELRTTLDDLEAEGRI